MCVGVGIVAITSVGLELWAPTAKPAGVLLPSVPSSGPPTSLSAVAPKQTGVRILFGNSARSFWIIRGITPQGVSSESACAEDS
jgi:hypothetical protein